MAEILAAMIFIFEYNCSSYKMRVPEVVRMTYFEINTTYSAYGSGFVDQVQVENYSSVRYHQWVISYGCLDGRREFWYGW
jgi:hypothetical protein